MRDFSDYFEFHFIFFCCRACKGIVLDDKIIIVTFEVYNRVYCSCLSGLIASAGNRPRLSTLIRRLLILLVLYNNTISIGQCKSNNNISIGLIQYHSNYFSINKSLLPLSRKSVCMHLVYFGNNDSILISSSIRGIIDYSLIVIDTIIDSSSISNGIRVVLISSNGNKSALIIIVNGLSLAINIIFTL